MDEDKMQFFVTSARNWKDENPDVLDFTQVTGVDLDTSESRTEEMRETPNGERVSYNPPRYTYYYDFDITIMVNHPYFDSMNFQLNRSTVEVEETGRRGMFSGGSKDSPRIREYEEMGLEIKRVLTEARQIGRDAAAAAAAPKQAVNCPWCGATTQPTANGCCEYCGGSLND